MPDQTVISDDAVTSGLPVFMQTKGARPHEWLALTGGAIGQGLPLAVGAAVACPDRKVLALSGDGAAMYTVQALWTLARIAGRNGGDLRQPQLPHPRHRADPHGGRRAGPAASGLLDLGDPRIDWVSLASGLGLPAVRCATAESFDAAFAAAMAQTGPSLIEVQLA